VVDSKQDRQHPRDRNEATARTGPAARPAVVDPPAAAGNALALPTPDWLHHTLTLTGPTERLDAFRAAVRGPGVPPFSGVDRLQEDWLLRLLAPPPARRGISVEGARILSASLRERAELRAQALLEAPQATACPLDLHALVPMPPALLQLGPDDLRVIAWLWTNWGTTWPLRHVRVAQLAASASELQGLPAGHGGVRYRFWSADWTPWHALVAIRTGWPDLTLRLAIDYGTR
jgi:hypothetical protein